MTTLFPLSTVLNDSLTEIWDLPHMTGLTIIIRSIVFILVSLMIFFANIPVFVFVPHIQSLRNSTGVAMMSLASADVGLGMFVLCIAINGLINGFYVQNTESLFCKIGCISQTFAGVSILTLTFIYILATHEQLFKKTKEHQLCNLVERGWFSHGTPIF